jgi:CRISPR type III-A-associated RAMP protein Csm4
MNPALLIRLRPITPWRIGPDHGALDQSEAVLHSDALYSALCLAFEQLGWLEEWLNATADPYSMPAVRFSSCFPWQRGLLFAPPPMGLWPPAETPGALTKLRWKGARLVPTTVISALLRGEAPDEKDWTVDAHSGCLIPTGGRFPTGPFRRMRRSSAAVDRVTGSNIQPWAAGCLQFAPASGLWCAAEFSSGTAYAVWSPKLECAFRLLADSGLGGLRSRGFGRSRRPDLQPGALQELLLPGLPLPRSGAPGGDRLWWLLSLFSPGASDSVAWGSGNYALIERSGRVASHVGAGLVKKSSRLVKEGSTVASQGVLTGSVRDVAPDGAPHPVWRAGFAVALELPGKDASGKNHAGNGVANNAGGPAA